MASARILVVDDEPAMRALLERLLRQEGFAVALASTAKEGLHSVEVGPPDMIILDLNLPDINGKEVCRQIRKTSSAKPTPILILTGSGAEGLPAQCLNGGADDYLSKPFDSQELVARVRALLRRPSLYAPAEAEIQKTNISILPEEHSVLVNGHSISNLAPKEFDVLYQLLLHAPKVLNKNTLALKVWGVSAVELNTRTLDVHIRRIRQKLGETVARCLKTIPAVGYQWFEKS